MNQMNERQMQQHVMILGWLHILTNMVTIAVGMFVFVLLNRIGPAIGDPEVTRILGVVGPTVGGFVALLGLPGILAGIGLLMRQIWGRYLAIIVGILGLINIPIGTAVGIYTVWVLLQDAATDYFASEAKATRPAAMHSVPSPKS